MRIENLTKTQNGQVARVSATIVWEDCDRPPFELFFETEGLAADDLDSNPHAYLVGCLVPAMHFGEKRIRIMEEVCPELLKGLETNMRWFQQWSGGQLQPLKIECTRSRADLSARIPRRAGSFLSAGVDSLAMLRSNRLDFPADHSAAIRDCVVVDGFDMVETTQSGSEGAYFGRLLDALREVARDAEVNLVPIRTNVRLLHDDVMFWMHYFHGAALASAAHALSKRLARIYIASSHYAEPIPWGSHPLVDPNYGSYALQIRHDGATVTRLEKVRLLADWDVALQNLRVCTVNPTNGLNCGACEKCIRTMLELLAVGRLQAAETFPVKHIEVDMLDAITIGVPDDAYIYWELLLPLTALGHHRIAERIRTKLADFEKRLAWEQEEDWKGAVKRFDRRFLGSGLYRSWKTLRPYLLKMSRKEAQL